MSRTQSQSQSQGKEIQQAVAAPPADGFLAILEKSKGEIARVLPEGVSADRVCRMARSLYQTNPDLRQCDPGTILATVMKAAELNLELGGGLKQAWALPFRNTKNGGRQECQFVIGYQGTLELARRSGAFRTIDARTVLDSDHFSLEYTPRPILSHRPDLAEAGAEIGAYAYAVLSNGETVVEWMSRKTIEQIRSFSKQQHVWNSWWGEKAKNAALKRLLKRQPLSIELRRAIDEDDASDAIEASAQVQAQAPTPALTRSAGLAARLRSPGAQALKAIEGDVEADATAEDYNGGEVVEDEGVTPA